GGACLPSLHDADVLRGSAGVPGRLSLVRADLVGGPLRVLVHPSARVAGARAFFASASLLRFSGHRGAWREPAAVDRRLGLPAGRGGRAAARRESVLRVVSGHLWSECAGAVRSGAAAGTARGRIPLSALDAA